MVLSAIGTDNFPLSCHTKLCSKVALLDDIYLPYHDPYYGEAISITFDFSELFKHPLKAEKIGEYWIY
jgi:hypothetical protein